MFKYEASAPTPAGLLTVLRNELGHLFSGGAHERAASEAPAEGASVASPAATPSTELPAPVVVTSVTGASTSPVYAGAGKPSKPKRGRPPGSKKSEPAALVISPAVNSAAAESPAQATTAAAAVSFDEMKAALVALGATDGGLDKAEAIIAKHGYQKIRDIKPEHFAAIHAAAVATS